MRRARFGLNSDAPLWAVVVFSICIPIFRGLRSASKAYRKAQYASRFARFRRMALARHLPKSEPLLNACHGRPPALRGSVTFLDLPPEIRQQIYDLVLPAPRILQPTYGCTLSSARPANWPPGQHIRTDQELPSMSLSNVACLGGSGLDPSPAPPSHGCVIRGCVPDLIYGMGCTIDWEERDNVQTFLDLMCTCHLVYENMLHRLYGECTISLFGTEMVHYFLRNVSPEGLRCIRYLHIGITLPIENWKTRRLQKKVVETFHRVARTLTSLQELDVEMAFTPGSPKRPVQKEHIWQWLRNDVFDQFRGLKKFVLKLPVYEKPEIDSEAFSIVPGNFWDESEYSILKESLLETMP